MPPITPPAIAPTSGPEFVDFVDELIVDGTAEEGTHCIFWHSWQVTTVCEQTVPIGQVGQIRDGCIWTDNTTSEKGFEDTCGIN